MCSNDRVVQHCSNACPVIKDTIPDFIMIQNSAHVSVNSFYFQHHLECWIIWELFQGPITVRKNINHLNQDCKPPASITNILTSLGYHRWFKIYIRGNRISWRSLSSTCKPMVRSVTHTHYQFILLRSWFKTLLFSFKYFRPY